MFSAVRFIIAAVIVALSGGFLLTGVLTQPRDEITPAVGAPASASAHVDPTLEAVGETEPAPTDADAAPADPVEQADLPGTFSSTGAPTAARWLHTATLLGDGRVLVVGGAGDDGSLISAEAWDPETESFGPAGSLAEGRFEHTATLLPDGRVLVVGGRSSGNADALTSAEVWDPETASFAPAGSLAEGHGHHTATLLPDGRVLIVGGYRRVQSPATTAEVWDPETASFSPVHLLAANRFGHSATLLPDGRVLIAGGEGGGSDARVADPQVEAWDPVTTTSIPAGSLAEGRLHHTATLLLDGRVLVVGGRWLTGSSGLSYAPTSVAEIWDPVTASFGMAGLPLADARLGHTATGLPDGRVLVIGGVKSDGDYPTSAETWDPATLTFSPAGALAEERMEHTATLLPDGRVLVVGGGIDGGPAVASAEVWKADGSSPVNQAVRTTPESTTYPPIELPAEIPEGIEWGTLETPLGPARWVHLTGDETSVPPRLFGAYLSGMVISTPDGYVMPAWGDEWWGGGEAKLWRSSDLIGWTSEPLGIEGRGGELSRAGDTYWLNVDGPGSLWRSPDTKSWEQVSFERLVPPGPEGFAWTLRPGRPLTHGGVTIVPFEWVTDSWIVTRGLSGADQLRAVTLVETSPGVFDIDETNLASFDLGTFATVRFEETEDGLRVLDHEDGTELKLLEGVSMEFIKLLAYRYAGEELVDVKSQFDDIAWQPLPRLAILDGAELVEVEPPLESEPYRQAYTVDEAGFLSVTIGPDGLAHMHRSQDGREWRETDVIGDDLGEPSDLGEVWSERGSVQMGNSVEIWTLTDELEWESHAPVPLWTEPTFLPIGSGWILVPFDTNPVTGVQDVGPGNIIPQIWFQPAEGEPVPIDVTDMAMPAEVGNCGNGGGQLSPNTIASHFAEVCAGVREAWIITFDDVPA